jgi:hypothetical protein
VLGSASFAVDVTAVADGQHEHDQPVVDDPVDDSAAVTLRAAGLSSLLSVFSAAAVSSTV